MAEGDGFDAGSIFVQVVPSFRDTQRIIERDSKEWGDQLEKELSDGLERGATKGAKKAGEKLKGALTDELGKDADKAGEKAADEYAGAFRTKLQNAIKSMQRELKPIELNTGSTQALAELDKLKARIDELSKAEIKPGMSTSQIRKDLDGLLADINRLGKDAEIEVKADTSEATKAVKAFNAYVESLDPKMEIKVDSKALQAAKAAANDLMRGADKAARSVEKQAEAAMGSFERRMKAGIKAATAALGNGSNPELARIRKELDNLGGKPIGISISSADAMAELERIHLEVARINALSPEVDVRIDSGHAIRELQKIVKEVDTLDGKTKQVHKQGGLVDWLLGGKGTGGKGQEAANAFRAFNGVLLTALTLGPALIPVLAGIAGGMAALAPAALAGASGAGVLMLAFSGIGDAVSALNDAQDSAAKDSVTAGRTMRNASQGVEDAQRSLVRARRDAKQAGLDAAKAVADAEEAAAERNADAVQRVADARRAAAESIESALKRQEDAEKRLARAQVDAKKAQDDLAAARLQAQKDLDDIADRSKQNALDIRQAQIDLFNATVANNATQADPGATNLEKEQADINLQNARLRMEELRETQGELADDQKKAAKSGVDGTDVVVSAQERLNDALEAQKDAQDAAKESAADLRNAQAEGIRSVNEALADQRRAAQEGSEAVADAEENRRRVAVQSAESIGDAQRNLERAQQAYNDALYDTGVQGSTAMQKVDEAMGKLGPEAQAFAIFISGLRDEFYALRALAAAGILPGVQELMQTLITTYGPAFLQFVGSVAKVMGDLAVALSDSLIGDTWKAFFDAFGEVAPQLINDFGLTFINWLEVGASWMTLLLPDALKLSGYLLDLSKRAKAFMESSKGKKFWTDFFAYVAKIGPEVRDFFFALGGAVVAIAKALAPVGEDLLSLVTNVLDFIATMDPKLLQLIVVGIIGLAVAFQFASAMTFLLWTAVNILASPLQLILLAIGLVALALYLLYTRSDTARKIIDAAVRGIGAVIQFVWDKILKPYLEYGIWVWGQIASAIKWAWEGYIKPALKAFGEFLGWLWENVLGPVFGFIGKAFSVVASGMKWAWDNIIAPVLKVFGTIAWELWEYGLKFAFSSIATGFRGLADGFKWVYDNIIKPLFDVFMKYIGEDVVEAFKTAVGFIAKHWDAIKAATLAPIQWVIDIVINKGLIAGFNKLASLLHMDPIQPLDIPKLASQKPTATNAGGGNNLPGFWTGGVTGVMPGYTPGRDVFQVGVSGGEAIMRPEWTRAIKALDPDYIDRMNLLARRGGVGAVQKGIRGYYNGGEVDRTGGLFKRTTFRGKTLDFYTIRMIEAAEKLLGQSIRITQGSFSTSVAASGSTHAGGGAIDVHAQSYPMATRLAITAALREVGFAAWLRNPSQGPWPYHIHGIAIGDPTASPSALAQVRSYLSGGDGLGGKDDGPDVGKDKSLLSKLLSGLGDLGGGLAGWAQDAISAPAEWLKGQMAEGLNQLKSKFGDSKLTQILTAIPERLVGGLVDKIKGFNPFGGSDAGSTGDLKTMAKDMLAGYGWSDQWADLDWLVGKESGWNPKADNPESSAYGLLQLLSGTAPKTDDPREQLRLGLDYIKQRYGSVSEARNFHEKHGWYKDGGVVPDTAESLFTTPTYFRDSGGTIPQGLSQVLNLTGDNEHAAVFTTDQWEHLQTGQGGDIHINVPMSPSRSTPTEVADEVLFAARRIRRGGAYVGGSK